MFQHVKNYCQQIKGEKHIIIPNKDNKMQLIKFHTHKLKK